MNTSSMKWDCLFGASFLIGGTLIYCIVSRASSAIQLDDDVLYYSLLIPLSLPVLSIFAGINWIGMRLFQNN
eukprot:m.35011 g.35011  ORF g.35011 m.35011 type:complete len:72 (-) comp14368_c0_seq2:117-332(-)